jgi:lipopolysaccharide/colanic/teichoic acid biosynthesis glycosyltransferase
MVICPSPGEAGITGWAQINSWCDETDTKEKIEQRVLRDLDCIDQWSLGFDLYFLLKTPLALLKTQNAS